ncbi:calmodulin-like [Littorina saxatilis]|uniref:calmodulin-like n=1 Tax=Littorina saxatilis TaxID=31220 RepID=UPI0038B68B05
MGTIAEDQDTQAKTSKSKSTKSRKFIKFSPRLRKKRSVKENAVKDMESTGAASRDLSQHMPNGLNDKEKHELQSIFEMFDKNKDGKISCDELGVVLRTLGHRYSQTEVEEMIKNADKNDNGYVEYDEFLILMKRWSANAAQQDADLDEKAREDQEAREAFRIFDMDGNGYIDRHELRFIMSKLGESPGEDDICEMFRLADLNGDGLIDYEEFTQMMNNMSMMKPPARSPASSSTSSSKSSKSVKKK